MLYPTLLVIAIGLRVCSSEGVFASEVGTSATLRCDARFYQGVPYFVEWFRGSVAIFSQFNEQDPYIHPAFQGRVVIEDRAHFVLQSLQSGDGGNYTCRMHLIDGDANVYEQWTVLQVLDAPSFLYTPPAYMTGREGGSISLRCRATGSPTPVLTWYKNGVTLEASERILINGETLQINELGSGDVGRYRCKFSNMFGHTAYTTTLVLEGGALITELPRNLTVNIGDPVTFRCQGRASPNNITYTWFKDGVNIFSIRRLSPKSRIDADGSLFITTVGENDSGVYKCTVTNGLGAPMSAEAHLSVVFTPSVDSGRWETNVYIPIGGIGKLSCPVKGYPIVTSVVWAKTIGSIDFSSRRFTISDDFTLMIEDVERGDSGWYTCTPHNENGPGVQSDLMRVVALVPPQFIVQPDPVYTVPIHSSVTLPCSALSDRRDRVYIEWKKKDASLPSNSAVHTRGNLTISDIRKVDGGIYECAASDGEISSVVSTELIVKDTTPHAPLNVTARFRHYDIKVSWKAGFDGGFKQTFIILFRETGNANGNWQDIKGIGGRTDRTINGLIPDTEYELKVLSRNELGDGEASDPVVGRTLGYTPGAVGVLPKNSAGQFIYPSIVKRLGPEPTKPANFTAQHDLTGGAMIQWQHPEESPVPILYYKIEYRTEADSLWNSSDPIQPHENSTQFVPKDIKEDEVVKYFFRVRAYGLLSYSDHSEAVIIYFPKKEEATPLGIGAKIGIATASLFFVGLLIAVVVILCDLKPSRKKDKSRKDKDGIRSQYSIAPQTPNGTSEWQSFYPYHGGRFSVNGEADNIYVIDSQRDHGLTNSSTERDGSMVRHEQGWYFPRDGHPEQDLTRTYESSSSGKPPPHGLGYTANYSNYNGLLHGYYDARTGTQISPSVVNYPHSGLETGNVTDGQMSNGTTNRRRFRVSPNVKVLDTYNILPSGNESHPIYANQAMVSHSHGADPNWFTPHSYPQNSFYQPTPAMSPISLSYDREQEIVLKPSLPRHSSMKPSIQVPADDEAPPFEPNMSRVRETSINPHADQTDYGARNTMNYPYTNGWVESQAPTFNSRLSFQGNSVSHHQQRGHEQPSRLRGYHTLAANGAPHFTGHPQHTNSTKLLLERGSSVSSSANEMRIHYNRDRLLGTVDRVRSTSSRSRRPASQASLSSGQPSPNGYIHSPVPPPYQLTERYPELVSPVYYNNNNNRPADLNSPGTSNYQPPRNHSYASTSPHYENSGLLTSTRYRAPAFAHDNSTPSRLTSAANATSGIGSMYSQSRLDGDQRRSRPSWSRSSAPTPYEYDMSCESSPSVVLPQFSGNNSRYTGLYSKARHSNSQNSPYNRLGNARQPYMTSYDPSYLLSRSQSYKPPPQSSQKLTAQAPSDSVDENYEFDPILIDSEPQDFFHIHNVDMPDRTKSTSSPAFRRPSLYAEQHTPLASSNSQFSRLRNEFNNFKASKQRLTLSRLESDIL